MLLVLAFATEPDLVPRAQAASALVWASVVFAGAVSSVGATVALFWLVQRREAGSFTPYLLTTPIVTTIMGVTFFHDVLSVRLIAGSIATLIGVGLVAVAQRRGTAVEVEVEVLSSQV